MTNISNKISVSIGIPAYNEAENIENLLLNLISQEIRHPFKLNKVYIVASGCTDDTEQIVEDLKKKYDIIDLLCEEERRGKASALNIILDYTKKLYSYAFPLLGYP